MLADPKLTEPRSDSQFDVPDILDVPRNAIVQQYRDVANVLQRRKAPEAANVIELTAFGIESTARVSVVRCKRALNLLRRQSSAGETVLIEQHLVLHRPAAEAGIVGNPRYRSVLRLDGPVFERLHLGERQVSPNGISINLAGRVRERRELWRHVRRNVDALKPLERLLAGEDEDMYRRLLASGARGLYLPDLVIHHYVPPERLTKRYFRRWCFWNGVSHGLIERERRTPVAYLLGVPRYLYGRAARGLLRMARGVFSNTPAQSFSEELAVWDFAGFFYGKHFYRAAR